MARLATLFFLLALALAASAPLPAQTTRAWTVTGREDFEHGRPEGVAITRDGRLEPGPALREILTTPSSYVWSVAAGKNGEAFLATGSPATVLRVGPDGRADAIFATHDLEVQLVRLGPDGMLYAATLPGGRVYRLDPAASSPLHEDSAELVFDPAQTEQKPKYVWDIAFDAAGRAYLATGAPAAVYRLAAKPGPGVKPELFFSSDEPHIRALAFDHDGNLIAGSDGSGLVYRIDREGKGFVLFDAPKREIPALAVGSDGVIYAASAGDKSRSSLPPLPLQGIATATVTILAPGTIQSANHSASIPDGSEIYALGRDQAPRRLWSSRSDIVYALAPAADGGVYALTGNGGHIYRVRGDGDYADVGHVRALQAAAFAASGSGLLIGTANTGRLYRLEETPAKQSTYTSDVFDAQVFSRWGRIDAEPGSRGYTLSTRSGNVEQPERGWSEWQPVAAGRIASPPARFLEWRAELVPGASLGAVTANYLQTNMAPVVEETVVVAGARAAVTPSPGPAMVMIALPGAQAQIPGFPADPAMAAPLPAQKDAEAVTVRWSAHDDNGDELEFDVYYRGDDGSEWLPLRQHIRNRYLSFHRDLLPDGGYRLKIVASDAPARTPADHLEGERVTERFELDSTAPVITGLKAGRLALSQRGASTGIAGHVEFEAADELSVLSRAEVSVDAGPWQAIEPRGRLSDSKNESYSADFLLPFDPGFAAHREHLVSVRVWDRHDNAATARVMAAP